MKFSFDKVLSAFGNTRAMEGNHVDDFTEAIINEIENPAFAVSQQNVMYADVKELGGYYYFMTIIIGAFKIKTNKGATLTIIGTDLELVLNADMEEFESEFSNVSNRSITRIDFQIEEEDIPKIDKSLIDTLTLTGKKHQLIFTTIKD